MKATALVPLVVVVLGCGDDPVRHVSDASLADSNPAVDAAVDAAIDAPASTFTAKDTCPTAVTMVDYSGNNYVTNPHFASAPGSPVVAVWNKSIINTSAQSCEGLAYASSVWGNGHTIFASCESFERHHARAGNGAAFTVFGEQNSGAGRRVHTDGTTWTDVGTLTADIIPYQKTLAMGAGGHAVEAWKSTNGVNAAIVGPGTAIFTPLGENTVSPVGGIGAAIAADGSGIVAWISNGQLVARRFAAGAWTTAAIPLAPGGTINEPLSVTLLPGGAAYVVWNRIDGSPALKGAQLSSADVWGAVDDLGGASTQHRVFAAADGELTVIDSRPSGLGGLLLDARRRAAGASTFDAVVPLGDTTLFDAVMDAAGHVTVGRNVGDGRAFHHRIAKGATTWNAGIRVDAASGTGSVAYNTLALAIEPSTGDVLLGWVIANDLLFTRCH